MTYESFFKDLTGHDPFPYQVRLSERAWPEVVDVPTGLGKTQAVIAAWLFRQLRGDTQTGRRLVYCLPMRTLVEQTRGVAEELCRRSENQFRSCGAQPPTVHTLMGGFLDQEWELEPDCPAILIGTQDMLLSRALARGYGMSRYKWPVQFGLLHSDCLWVLDETQLMGVGVETSAQLDAFRRTLGTFGPSHTIWMSATLGRSQIETVDHPRPQSGFLTESLDNRDFKHPIVELRTGARKSLSRADTRLSLASRESYIQKVATLALESHRASGGLTLVVLNRVDRAQAVFRALSDEVQELGLVHSRFRAPDRMRHERHLLEGGDRIVVATQAVEAGLDVSSRTLITELAPWPSLVQRFGRCNRFGEDPDARIFWVDIEDEGDQALPYLGEDLAVARNLLEGLAYAGPRNLQDVDFTPPPVVRPVLRRRDLLDLFDTSPDLLGNDIDVSRFVRDGDDTDVLVYYREFDAPPGEEMIAPQRGELVRVSISAARTFLDKLKKKRKSLDKPRDQEIRTRLQPWRPDPLTTPPWTSMDSVHPGQLLLLHGTAGGYDSRLGWTGMVLPSEPVEPVRQEAETHSISDFMDADPRTCIDRWVTLDRHLSDVAREATDLSNALPVSQELRDALVTAALWHDLGKVHDQFQRRLVDPVADDPEKKPPGTGPWAKSGHRRPPPKDVRPYFRHELASALGWLQAGPPGPHHDLIAYLIAAHHGKVRLSIRSVPGEARPPEPGRLFARGVWDGDRLPEVSMGNGTRTGPVELDLSVMQLGSGSWLERTLALRDDPALGPFRLGYLEAVVRIADWRASAKERNGA